MTDTNDTAANPDVDLAQQDATVTKTDDAAAAPADAKAADAKKPDAPAAAADKGVDDAKPADDWRVRLANGDEKELKRLGRFATEADVYKAYRELENKLKSGEMKKGLPKDATPEDIAQWRKENGIPEAPDKYDLTFENGLVIGEEDKPYIDKFVTKMHGENATPAQVKAAVASYYEIMGEQQQAIAEADAQFKDSSLELLREEWGGDYKKNLNAVNGLISSMPDEVRAYFETARTADGKVLGNDPEVVKWLAQTAFEINPAATVMPNSMSNPGAGITDEITSIEKMVGDRDSDYWRGAKEANGNTKMQNRYAELIAARDKIAARG